MKKTDKLGYTYTLYGVYDVCRHKIEGRLKKIDTRQRTISYGTFRKIIHAYFEYVLSYVIETCVPFVLPNKMGRIQAVKTMCTRYNPKTSYYVTENGERKKYWSKIDVNKTGGYMYFVFWECSQKIRMFRFSTAKKWKKMIMDNVKDGGDYIDISEFHGHLKKGSSFAIKKRNAERKRWKQNKLTTKVA